MSNVSVIKVSETQDYKIKQIIDLAGFRTIVNRFGITLEDKNSSNADNYADLTFPSLYEAARAIQPYIIDKFRIVA